jgi:pSer/pThr/pTyr-binding forkhead associated (FHA) protein
VETWLDQLPLFSPVFVMAQAQEPLKLVWAARQLEFDLVNQRYKIGRGQHNDIQIPDQLVSSNHAMIQNGYITDKGSTNGTFINGEAIEKNQKRLLKAGDVIMFGDTQISVERGLPYETTTTLPGGPSGSTAESDSDSDEDDSAPSLTATVKKSDENPIAWHPGVSPNSSKANGNQSVHHAADTQASTTLGLMALRTQPDLNRHKAVANARLQTERKQKERERKLESQVEELKHQLLYGAEQTKKNELSAQQQLVEVKKQLESIQAQLRKTEEELKNSLFRAQSAEDFNKSLDTQLKFMIEHVTKLQNQFDLQQPLLSKLDVAFGSLNPNSKEVSDERQQILKTLKAIALSHTHFTRQVDSSLFRIKWMVFISMWLIVLFLSYLIGQHRGWSIPSFT